MPTVIPAVQAVMDDLVERDVERGLQVAAYVDGRLVLDTWSGLADASTHRPVDGDTLFVCFCVAKVWSPLPSSCSPSADESTMTPRSLRLASQPGNGYEPRLAMPIQRGHGQDVALSRIRELRLRAGERTQVAALINTAGGS